MNVLYLLIPIALVIVVIAIKLLFWAINNGQYDDLDMEGHRILFDDDDAQLSKNKLSKHQPYKNQLPDAQVLKVKASKDKACGSLINMTSDSEKPESIDKNKSESNEK